MGSGSDPDQAQAQAQRVELAMQLRAAVGPRCAFLCAACPRTLQEPPGAGQGREQAEEAAAELPNRARREVSGGYIANMKLPGSLVTGCAGRCLLDG